MSLDTFPILVTTCTKTKSVGSRAYIPHDHALFQTQDDLLQYWVDTVKKVHAEHHVRARLLYTGRSFKRALMATDERVTDLYIISAGLGLIRADQDVVPYDLTTSSAAPNRVSKQIAFGGFSPSDWWLGINRGLYNNSTPIANLVRKYPERTVILCLSKEYLKMILDDIGTLTGDEIERVRVIGSDLDELLPINMFNIFMPYDLRINASDEAMPGSRLDFSIRAAMHFITKVMPESKSLEEQKELVRATLGKVNEDNAQEEATSRAATDEEIIALIKDDWSIYHGRKIMHLRALREKHKVRCSQQRFDKIYLVAKTLIE